MPTNIAELQAKFTADVGQLQASVNSAFSGVERVVNKTVSEVKKSFEKLNEAGKSGVLEAKNLNKVQAGFEALGQAGKKQLDELSGSVKTSGKEIATTTKQSSSLKKEFSEVGQAAAAIGHVIGGTTGDAVLALSGLAITTKNFSVILSGLGGAGVIAALGGIVAGLVSIKEITTQAAFNTKRFNDEIERTKKLQGIQSGLGPASATRRSTIDAIGQDPSLAGKPGEQAKATIAALEASLGELRTKLAESIAASDGRGGNFAGALDSSIKSEIQFISDKLDQAKDALKQFDDQAKRSTGLKDSIEEYKKAITRSTFSLDLFGERQAEIKSRMELTKGVILDLVSNGISVQDEHIQALIKTYGQLKIAMQQVEEQKKQSDAALAENKATEEAWKNLVDSFRFTQAEILNGLASVISSFIDGIAGAIATAAIYGTSFADIMTSVFAAASQELIKLALKSFIELIGIAISLIVVDNYRAYASIPFIGLALGAAGAAATIAAARSTASSKGGHAFAEGGIVTGPMLGLVGEAGNEAIIPLDRLNEFIADRPGSKSPDIYLDGFLMTSIIARILPKYLKHKGVA